MACRRIKRGERIESNYYSKFEGFEQYDGYMRANRSSFQYNCPMQYSTPTLSRPIGLSASTESKTYLLFGLAMGLTVLGIYAGVLYANTILGSGMYLMLTVIELAIIFTSGRWSRSSPLNYILFIAFPLLSGITITPYLMMLLAGYANGASILLNALGATTFMALAAAVVARSGVNMSWMGRSLIFAVIGLIVLGLLQLFVPALRSQPFELLISGLGVAVFGVFTAYDIQRISQMGKMGANPFMLALSLYLDIFNLFLYVLRFMTALSGERR